MGPDASGERVAVIVRIYYERERERYAAKAER